MAEPYKYGFMPEPWIDTDWFTIGPFLSSEEERRAYERSREQRKKAQPNAGGLPSLVQPTPLPEDRERSLEEFLEPPLPARKQGGPGRKPTGKAEDVRRAGEAGATIGGMAGLPAQPPSMAIPRPGMDLPPQTIEYLDPPAEDTGIPAEPVMSPREQMLKDLQTQRELIDQIYPRMQYDDTSVNKGEEFAEREMQRANALAQLAFFSGVTQGAGGSWEGVGRGLAGAGQAYSEGFARYHKALQSKAARMDERAKMEYEQDVGRADAALSLYQSQEKAKRDAIKDVKAERKEAEESRRKNRDDIYKYFTKRFETIKGDDFMPPDPAAVESIFRDLRRSLDAGEIIETTDVRDVKA